MNLAQWEPFVANAASGVIRVVLEHLPQTGTLVDVGANVGAVSKAAMQLRGARIFAFEPVPEYYDRCREVLGPYATVEPFALGDDQLPKTLYCDSRNLGWNTFVEEQADIEMRPIRVPMIRFDNYAAAHPDDLTQIDVVKIDVEGYEYAVLAGMHDSLLRFHPVLVVELGWGVNHPQRNREVEELEWLFANGYQRINYDFGSTTDVVILPE